MIRIPSGRRSRPRRGRPTVPAGEKAALEKPSGWPWCGSHIVLVHARPFGKVTAGAPPPPFLSPGESGRAHGAASRAGGVQNAEAEACCSCTLTAAGRPLFSSCPRKPRRSESPTLPGGHAGAAAERRWVGRIMV